MKTQTLNAMSAMGMIVYSFCLGAASAHAEEAVTLRLNLSITACEYENEESARNAALHPEQAELPNCTVTGLVPSDTVLVLLPEQNDFPFEVLSATWTKTESFGEERESVHGKVEVTHVVDPEVQFYAIHATLSDDKGYENTTTVYATGIDHTLEHISLKGNSYVRGTTVYTPKLEVGPKACEAPIEN